MDRLTKSKTAILFVSALLLLPGCDKKNPAQQVKSNGLPQAASQTVSGEIAYVDIDTLSMHYDYCKEAQKALETKQNNYRAQLNSKGQSLQKAILAFQNDMQHGTFSSQQQAEKAQTQIQHQQQQLQQLQQNIESEMAKAAELYQKTLRDSISNFLKDFNKDRRYKMILSKSGDNILYADKSLDITNDVISGLNKRYKKN